jgi:3-dehydroquinate synthetase
MTSVPESRFTRLRFPGLIGLDVGGERVTAAVCGFDEAGRLRSAGGDDWILPTPLYDAAARRLRPRLEDYFRDVLAPCLADHLAAISARDPEYRRLPIGISFSGQVDREGRVHSASSIFRGARPVPGRPLELVRELRRHAALAGREFTVLNNVGAAAWRFSLDPEIVPSAGNRPFLVVHLGSGFGSKAFDALHGGVLIDESGLAGELGHVRVGDVAGLGRPVPCDCGRADHLAAFFLAEGLRSVCERHCEGLEAAGFAETVGGAGAPRGHGGDLVRRLYEDPRHEGVGARIVATLASVLAGSLASVVLGVGIGRIVLKGGLFHRFGPRVSGAFVEALRGELAGRLEDYFPVGGDFVVLRAFARTDDGREVAVNDRLIGLEGLAVHAAAQYRRAHRVTSGYLSGHPCLTLSCTNDIRYPVIRTAGVFDCGNDLLRELLELPGRRRRVLAVVDAEYDRRRRGAVAGRLAEYLRRHGWRVRVGTGGGDGVADTVSGAGADADVDVDADVDADAIVRLLDPVRRGAGAGDRENKTPEQADRVVAWCREARLPREGMLLAVGGGVVLDIVGFAAQQYRRMVPYLRIPTTLIGQVDAGVGAKVGVNHGSAKNLVGAFYPPYATVNDAGFLDHLEPAQLECGLAEIVKMGVVAEAEIVVLLERLMAGCGAGAGPRTVPMLLGGDPERAALFEAVCDAAVAAMMRELQGNLMERELRRLVDFGHTFGPRLESLSGYRIPHGYAVAVDVYLACRMASRILRRDGTGTLIDGALFERYRALLAACRLFVAPCLDGRPALLDWREDLFPEAVAECLRHRGGNLHLVVPEGVVGRGGFVELEGNPGAEGPESCAVLSGAGLRVHFDEAVASLYRDGERRDF